MKTSEIKVGCTYHNNGKGKTTRKVLEIGLDHRPDLWFGNNADPPPTEEPGVLYEQKGKTYNLYLSSFAKWAGGRVIC